MQRLYLTECTTEGFEKVKSKCGVIMNSHEFSKDTRTGIFYRWQGLGKESDVADMMIWHFFVRFGVSSALIQNGGKRSYFPTAGAMTHGYLVVTNKPRLGIICEGRTLIGISNP